MESSYDMAPPIVNPICFTDVKRIGNKVVVKGQWINTRTMFVAEVFLVSNMPTEEIHEGRLILPYKDRFYVITVELIHTRSCIRDSPIDFMYYEYMPAYVYSAMCGMIATNL